MSSYNMIAAAEMNRIHNEGGHILDVRTPMEHDQNHLGWPHNLVPLDALDAQDYMLRHGLTANDPVYILCRSGNRAKTAADKFTAAGYQNIYIIEGGIIACEEYGLPVSSSAGTEADTPANKTTAPISLERQVRIAAGALVVLGALFGFILSPIFYLLSLFVGGGLIYSGLTDRCGMALLLTKAPWNKSTSATCAADGKHKAGGGCA